MGRSLACAHRFQRVIGAMYIRDIYEIIGLGMSMIHKYSSDMRWLIFSRKLAYIKETPSYDFSIFI